MPDDAMPHNAMPDDAMPHNAMPDDAMLDLARHIDAQADAPLTLAALAARAGLSPAQLRARFTKALGVSPKAYQTAARLGRLKQNLRAGEPVTAASYGAGYGSASRLHAAARHLGMTPSAYRAGGRGETIAYAIRKSALGLLLMAATDRGVCAVRFGETRDALKHALAQEFPQARLTPSPAETAPPMDAWMTALAAHLDDAAPAPDLPLDIRGTAFQQRVWRFLLSIPAGETKSYAEAAAAIGAPKAVRAVGSACGKNKIAVLIPCHRVLRSDGSLGGYAYGLDRKRALLDAERAARVSSD